MDLRCTTKQVQGGRFRVYKFIDLNGIGAQIKGPLVYLTHANTNLSGLIPFRSYFDVVISTLICMC